MSTSIIHQSRLAVPSDPSRMHPITLRFASDDVESQYRDEQFRATLHQTRFTLAIGAAAVIGVGLVILKSAIADATLERNALFYVLGIELPVFCALLAASYTRTFRHYGQFGVAALAFLVLMGSSLLQTAPLAAGMSTTALFVAGCLPVYTSVKLRLPYAAVACWTSTLCLIAVGIWIRPVPALAMATDASALVAVNVFGIVAAYQMELQSRRGFVQRRIIEQQGRELAQAKDKADRLLANVLPESIAARLKESHQPIAERFTDVTVLFADIVGFTTLSETTPPEEVVAVLNEIFSAFDALADRYRVEKIKTIGDCYMLAGGLPIANASHADSVADMALAMIAEIDRFNTAHGRQLSIRIGINSGPVVAGVIGTRKFVYDLWGDAVNTASRMESHGLPGRIHVSAATFALLRGRYGLDERGIIDVKGKGPMLTYLLRAN